MRACSQANAISDWGRLWSQPLSYEVVQFNENFLGGRGMIYWNPDGRIFADVIVYIFPH